MSGASGEPRNLIERAADAALRAIEDALEQAGARPARVFVAIQAADVPAGERDAVVAATGAELPADLDERAREVVAFLIGEAAQAGKALGLDIRVVPLRQHGRG